MQRLFFKAMIAMKSSNSKSRPPTTIKCLNACNYICLCVRTILETYPAWLLNYTDICAVFANSSIHLIDSVEDWQFSCKRSVNMLILEKCTYIDIKVISSRQNRSRYFTRVLPIILTPSRRSLEDTEKKKQGKRRSDIRRRLICISCCK
jgi:hypothetical protein